MTIEISIARIIEFFLLASAFWFGWTFLYKDFRTDAFRQDLFKLRDELFDYAAEGKIQFDHPAYGILRIQINGAIRFAHQLSFVRLLLNFILISRVDRKLSVQKYTERIEKAFSCIESSEVSEKMRSIQGKFYFLIAKQLMLLNPLLLIISSLVLVYEVLKLLLKQTFRFSVRAIMEGAKKGAVQIVPSNTVKFIQTEAYIVGNEDIVPATA